MQSVEPRSSLLLALLGHRALQLQDVLADQAPHLDRKEASDIKEARDIKEASDIKEARGIKEASDIKEA